MEKFFERNYIRGYHVYKKVWAATVGEALVCEIEPKPSSDRYAVSVTDKRGEGGSERGGKMK